jgi:hypothetical protein
VAVLLLIAGCDGASSGKPNRSTAAAAASSGAAGPTGGPVGSSMCRDFRAAGGRVGDVRSANREAARLWAQLAADAPAVIKPDAEVAARFAAEVAAGRRPSTSGATQAVRALRRVTEWATQNCI